ncbi:MAG: AAA family ATPase, partial [Anaerolineales bacterium]|nr:AAA family ATPase [Anaerolineales bacterium]
MVDTILQTKLFIPAADGSLVVRQRLLDQLDQFPQRRLTLITAPAGFGKTTLITHWLQAQTTAASCWLSLDEQDNDPHRFLAYVAAAFQQIAPHIGAALQTALQSSTPLAIEPLLTALLNELTAYKRPCLFVLDDFHLLTDTTVQEIVAFFIEHRPPNLHLIITSRTALPFSVAKWRVRRQLLEITTADLRFNHQEAAAFLQQAMHLNLNAADIAALEQRTEGWVAGLQLAALSLNGRPDPHSFINSLTGDNRYIIDYLLEEVFQQQPEHIRTFLLHTAVLDRFCADLCDAVLDNEVPPSQTILEYLEQHHLFLIPLDAQQKWFRYHHLFTDFLRYQLQRLYPERLQPLHSRAGRWYTQKQQRDEAMRYAILGQDWSLAAELIYEHGLDLIVNGEIQKLTKWFAPLPADLYTAQPLLSIYEGWVHMFSGRFDAAHASIAAVQQAPHDPAFPLSSFGKTIQAFIYLNRGRPSAGEPLAEAAIRELDEA